MIGFCGILKNEAKYLFGCFFRSGNKVIKSRVIIFIFSIIYIAQGMSYMVTNFSDSMVQTNRVYKPMTETTRSFNIEKIVYESYSQLEIGNFGEAVKIIDDAIGASTDSYQVCMLCLAKATLYYNLGDIDESIRIAKLGSEYDKNDSVFAFIAQAQEAKGALSDSIDAYAKAIDLINISTPGSDDDLFYYKSKIKELEKNE